MSMNAILKNKAELHFICIHFSSGVTKRGKVSCYGIRELSFVIAHNESATNVLSKVQTFVQFFTIL